MYRFLDSDGTVLYVGYSSAHPAGRLYKHKRLKGSRWWPKVTAFDWAEFDDPWTAREEEIQQIHRWHPEGNTRCDARFR